MAGIKIFRLRDILPQISRLLVRGRLKFRFELIPYDAGPLSWKKRFNFFRAGLNQIVPRSRPFGRPVIAQVEPANFCNLSCPLCLTASETASRPRSLLPFEAFRRFIDELGDHLLLIVMWSWGEPFLHPEIFRMIGLAKSKGILVHGSTNGNVPFDDARAEKLVDSGLDTLIFGVDGASQESYSLYRKGGDLEKVLENIRTVLRVRAAKRSAGPRINLRFVVMKHNEHEIPRMREIARELGVDFLSFKTVDLPPARGADNDPRYAPRAGRYRRYAYEGRGFRRIRRPFVCYRPWKRIVLDALGEIIPCEYDYRNVHSFGSIAGGGSALSLWGGTIARRFRKNFHFGWNETYLCRDCTYKNQIGDDCIVEIEDLRPGAAGRG